MATIERWLDEITCQCGAIVRIHWVDRCYRTAEPEIERVEGPAIKRRHKSGGSFDKDTTDVLCGPLRARAARERGHQEGVPWS